MRFFSSIGMLILIICSFWACQSSSEADLHADRMPPVIDVLTPADSTFTFLAEEGFEYKMSSGTEINIPKGALMEASNELVNGEVVLTFNEYKDALDLMAAGIPMSTESGMVKTAGAFKIEIKQDGQALFLDPTKNMEVKQACYEKEDDYSLFFSKNNGLLWDSLYSVMPFINEEHVHLERAIKKMKPRIKFPLEENHFAFSYKGILDVIYNNDLTNVSHPQTQKKMKKYGLRWSNINVEDFVAHEGKEEFAALMIWKNVSRKPFPAWTKNAKGSLQKIKNKRYRLIIENVEDGQKFSTQVEAIMPLKELFSYGPGFWRKDYNARIDKVETSYDTLRNMPSAYRRFSISQFGVYNWQKRVEEEESVHITARFRHNESELFKGKGYYYLAGDAKGLMYYTRSQWSNFTLFDDPNAKIFSISPKYEIELFAPSDLRSIDFDQLKKMNSPSFVFKMEKRGPAIQSLEELRDMLKAEP